MWRSCKTCWLYAKYRHSTRAGGDKDKMAVIKESTVMMEVDAEDSNFRRPTPP